MHESKESVLEVVDALVDKLGVRGQLLLGAGRAVVGGVAPKRRLGRVHEAAAAEKLGARGQQRGKGRRVHVPERAEELPKPLGRRVLLAEVARDAREGQVGRARLPRATEVRRRGVEGRALGHAGHQRRAGQGEKATQALAPGHDAAGVHALERAGDAGHGQGVVHQLRQHEAVGPVLQPAVTSLAHGRHPRWQTA